jgi:hypothetical protein
MELEEEEGVEILAGGGGMGWDGESHQKHGVGVCEDQWDAQHALPHCEEKDLG